MELQVVSRWMYDWKSKACTNVVNEEGGRRSGYKYVCEDDAPDHARDELDWTEASSAVAS